MKKLLQILAFFLITVVVVQAQEQHNIEFGLKGGLNYATYRTPNAFIDFYKGKPGFFLGGFASFTISEKFKVQPELLFAMQGARLVIKDVEIRDDPTEVPRVGDVKSNINESTIVHPVMVQYHINETVYIEAGPQFGFILSTKEKLITSPTDDPNFNSFVMSNPDTFDLGLAFGAGYRFTKNIGLNMRYFYGLLKRNNAIYSSVLNLGLEYKL